MHRNWAVAISLALSSCAILPPVLVYMPADVPSTTSGGCPSILEARLFERDGVALDFVSDPRVRTFGGRYSLLLVVPKGRTAAFLDSRVTIFVPPSANQLTAQLSCVARPLYSLPRMECTFDAPISDEEVFVVNLPPLEINGSRYGLDPIRVSLQKKLVLCWLSA